MSAGLVFGYSRLSEDPTGLRAGVERQRDDLVDDARRDGVRIDELLEDNDRSATNLRKPRPDFERLLELIEAGRVARLYIWHADRLYRTYEDLLRLQRAIERSGRDVVIRQHEGSDHIDLSTPDGVFNAFLLAGLAVREIAHKSARQRAAERDRAKDGRPTSGGTRPLGYRADRVTVDPVEAAALRDAAAYLLGGGTLAQACRNVSAALGRRIVPTTLRDSLTGPRIAGFRQYLSAKDRRAGKTTPELYPAAWPAILDVETWEALRALMLDPSRKRSRPARVGLLSGVLVCSLCGDRLAAGHVKSAGNPEGGTLIYRCSGSTGCGRNTVTASHVDAIVSEWARRRASSSIAVERERVELARARAHAGDNDAPETLADIDARSEALALLFADGKLPQRAHDAAQAKLAELRETLAVEDAVRVRRSSGERLVRSAAEDWDSLSMEQRREAIRHLTSSVGVELVVEPGRRGYRFNPDRIVFRPVERDAAAA